MNFRRMRRKHKAALTLAALGLLAFGLLYSISWSPERRMAEYFAEKLAAGVAADLGKLPPGLDADILMTAFPGFLESDFESVPSEGGEYQMNAGSLAFVAASDTTAPDARYFTGDSYETLLRNVSARLAFPAIRTEAVDAIVRRVNTGERVTARLGDGGSFDGIAVIPDKLLEDSRCPVDTECKEAGTVRVSAHVEKGGAEGEGADLVFKLGETQTVPGGTAMLLSVKPPRKADEEILKEEYRFIFEIRKESSPISSNVQ